MRKQFDFEQVISLKDCPEGMYLLTKDFSSVYEVISSRKVRAKMFFPTSKVMRCYWIKKK